MGRPIPEATIAIGRVRAMPFGRSRAEAAARQVRLIEAEGPDEVLAYALESLVEAQTWNGAGEQALVPFIKLLHWWDQHPEHFDPGDRNILFWEFGWVIADLARNPRIPAGQVERALDDMERRFAVASRGMERVWCCRLEWALLQGAPDVDKVFTTWLALPLDDEDSCPACHREHHADYLVETGDIPGAIAVLEQAIDAELTCSREPASMLALLAWCYVAEGRLEEAEATLPKALAELKLATALSVQVAYGRLFEALGRGGDLERARGLIDRFEEGLAIITPYARLETLRYILAGASGLVEWGYGEASLGSTTVAGLIGELTAQAGELTALFDRRHGTTVQAGRLERALAASPTARRLILPAPVAPDQPLVAAPGSDRPRESWPVLGGDAEAAYRAGDHVLAATLYREAAGAAQDGGRLAEAGWFWAEAARNAQEVGQYPAAAHDYIEAHARLRAAGTSLEDVAPLFVAWAPGVQEADYRTFLRLALQDYPTPAKPSCPEQMEDILPGVLQPSMVNSPLIRRYILARAEMRDAAARVMATWGDHADFVSALAMAEESATRFSTLGRIDAAAHAWWLAGKVAARLQDVSVDANFTMALQSFRSTGRRNRGYGRRAAGDYATYLAAAGRDKQAAEVRATWAGRED
ncbi:MAG: tetratricopeptide repeat protein [Propionibacteriaceae bacterium]|jgi:tetratricopeptide (TPR) repeat protein|nr:tetratricopeptide repeat protein [Propionibacteriaceae bacterium]